MKQDTAFRIFLNRLTALCRDDGGAVLMLTLSVFLFLFVMVSGVYVLGCHIEDKIKMQNAADAASYSAAAVQADALSRMAVVNKAMSWTYVQMSKRQMDYITYRWLKLTLRNFDEDCMNAKNFYAYYPWMVKIYGVPVYSDPDWVDFLVKGDKKCPLGHGDKNNGGGGWFCGLGKGKGDMIVINGSEISVSEVRSAVENFETQVLRPLEQELDCPVNNPEGARTVNSPAIPPA